MEKIQTMEKFWLYAAAMKDGFLFAMLTDEIIWKCWPLAEKEKKDFQEKERNLLDIRIFNEKKELHMFRSDVGRAFQGRLLEDAKENFDGQDYFDEEQYLDIDTKRSQELFEKEQKVYATRGGCYSLPLSAFEDAKIQIRNYLGYYEQSGQAYVKDWRLTGLFQEGR